MVRCSIQRPSSEDGSQRERCNSDTNLDLLESSGKHRLRWTQELRNRFEEAVKQLGGPDRATPKGILKIMALPKLTILHVKSRLQKYRMSKYIPESFDKGRNDKKKTSEVLPNFSTISGVQIAQALKLQMEVYRQLKNQTEAQRNLRLRIEAQGRYLDKIAEENHNFGTSFKPQQPQSLTSLPPLSEESESNARDDGSDSEVNLTEQVSHICFGSSNCSNRITEMQWSDLSMYDLCGVKEKDTAFEESNDNKRLRFSDTIFCPMSEEDPPSSLELDQSYLLEQIVLPKAMQFQVSNDRAAFMWPVIDSRESPTVSSF